MMDSIRAALAQVALGNEDGDLSIAIDFGTAYSSVSWIKGTTFDINGIREIVDWPYAVYSGPASSRVGEVPSEAMYRNGIKKHGYEVHKILGKPGHEQWHRLTNIKMLLDNSKESLTIRHENLQTIKEINTTRKGSQPEISVFSVIHDYLLFLLSHTKTQLLKKNVRGKSIYASGDPIKFTLSIPEKWDEVAKWTMQKALTLVTEELQFGSTKKLFMISESESASTCMLEMLKIVWSAKSEVVITCDAGGGTTVMTMFAKTVPLNADGKTISKDVATLRVINERPYRFKRVGRSEGQLLMDFRPVGFSLTSYCLSARCIGSSFLDYRFREYLEDRVKDQTYLNDIQHGSTIPELVDKAVLDFHNQIKRRFDGNLEGEPEFASFGSLAPLKERGFEKGMVVISPQDLADIFEPLCDKVWGMIEDQIRMARAENQTPSKVLLVGGFGLSLCLQKRIEMKLARWYEKIELVPTRELMDTNFTAVVSRGALFRSLNRNLGPQRVNRSGFGIGQNELYRGTFEGHKGGETFVDEVDGRTYVTDCVYYLYKPGRGMRPDGDLESHTMWEILRPGEDFNVRVPVYMSGRDCIDHHHIDHVKNSGAQKLGELVFMAPYDEIQKHSSPSSIKKSCRHIKFEVVIRMNGLSMEYEMRYPPKGKLRAEGRLDIAAAFDLGVA